MMQMAGLVDAVTQFLQKETSSTNVFVVLDLWVTHEMQKLVEECLKVYGSSL
jgi:cell division protein ZapA (FtsZ GTPase activity inhibitor)